MPTPLPQPAPQPELKYLEPPSALERVLQLADQLGLEEADDETKRAIATDYLELSAGYENYQPPDIPSDPLDPLSVPVTPPRQTLKHYRVFYVAAKIWMEDPGTQALVKAEQGVQFTQQIRPILSLIDSQEGYDEQHCLAVPKRWNAADMLSLYSKMAGIDLGYPLIMSAVSA